MIATAFFYALSGLLVLSALMVISARNPVHAVLFLILAFFNAGALFVLLGAEFIAMILVIVYVGAVAVLFLFVVMMLDINFAELRAGMRKYLPLSGLIGTVMLVELFWIFGNWQTDPTSAAHVSQSMPEAVQVTNTHALGLVLYTDYMYPFQISGLILLVAMVGAITLTLRTRQAVRRQNVSSQVGRKASDVLRVEKINTGEGVS